MFKQVCKPYQKYINIMYALLFQTTIQLINVIVNVYRRVHTAAMPPMGFEPMTPVDVKMFMCILFEGGRVSEKVCFVYLFNC